ncbi:MAG: hypothetical protein NTX64_00245 [Elusimicrobia bacterium]|nr:hypothetical protein [Elusimicrobiota bacterium]
MLLLDGQDRLGVGVAAPAAGVDVRGIADSGDLGLLLRVGNSSSSTSSSQLVFGYSGGTYRHRFETRAAAAQNIGNGMDFFLWHATADPAALGNFLALSLEAGVSGSTASFHVLPFGIADAEVEVSNSVTTGGGSIEYGTAGTHSARRLKSRIEYLENAQGAYDDVKGLKHARFRYRGGGPALRGLIYGDAPEGVRGPGKTVVLDYRVLELEMALQVAGREIQRLESRVAFLEKSHAH